MTTRSLAAAAIRFYALLLIVDVVFGFVNLGAQLGSWRDFPAAQVRPLIIGSVVSVSMYVVVIVFLVRSAEPLARWMAPGDPSGEPGAVLEPTAVLRAGLVLAGVVLVVQGMDRLIASVSAWYAMPVDALTRSHPSDPERVGRMAGAAVTIVAGLGLVLGWSGIRRVAQRVRGRVSLETTPDSDSKAPGPPDPDATL